MPRCIDDIDLDSFIRNSCVLAEDCDSSLTLDIAGVHDTLLNLLVRTERTALAEHRIDQRRLAVIDVSNDRYVSDILSCNYTHFFFL